ncbi:MAG: hypothetical protein MUQ56_01665, partial [Thermoleophilia bacterium]|nr:hypothetical protein [Thermoleophilia bacterium]
APTYPLHLLAQQLLALALQETDGGLGRNTWKEWLGEPPALGPDVFERADSLVDHLLDEGWLFADGGLIGLAVLLIPVGVWVGRGLRRPAARAWAIAVFAGLVGGLAVSLDNFRLFWLAVGVLAAVLSATASYQGTAAAARAGIHSPRNRHWR